MISCRRLSTIVVVLLALNSLTGYTNVAFGDETDDKSPPTVKQDIGKGSEASRTDDEVVSREEEAIKIDELNVSQKKQMRESYEKHAFQADVSRMMKLIINSLYKNKEIFLRELISNASDALDKIRQLALTDPSQLDSTDELSVRIKADKDKHILTITDTGVGMTKEELVTNLGTIAKSGTSDFIKKMTESQSTGEGPQQDLIGQFGVGFYSVFLVADNVVVTTKSNEDTKQWVWKSDATSFSIEEDSPENALKRGTQISLHLKEEAVDFLEGDTLKNLAKKYSQFINFPIYLWTRKTETVEEPVEDDVAKKEPAEEKKEAEDEAEVEEEKEETKPKTKKVEKTTWNWELLNDVKPLWTRKPSEVKDDEYEAFYKSLTNDYGKPLAYTHFTAEGEVTFKSLLYVPANNQRGFHDYGKKHENIKLYVRRVFITDDFKDMMPNYLSFIHGLVDSDDLPLNVSRETLQQNKLLKVIKKKLVRKVLDMLKKMDKEQYDKFWKEYSTNVKLGVIEDSSNKTRLAKLLRFKSSKSGDKWTSLAEYVERMKSGQTEIYYMADEDLDKVKSSPFVEAVLKKDLEVLYMTDPVDEYCMQSLPDFDGKKFQNLAKDGFKTDEKSAERLKEDEKEFEPLLKWFKESALKDQIEKATVSQRLHRSPCALVASSYGWSGNMERLMRSQAYAKANDPMQDFYAGQKKTLEVNPRHPLVRELLERVRADPLDPEALRSARLLFDMTAVRSGYSLRDPAAFADRIESMLRATLHVAPDAVVPEDDEPEVPSPPEAAAPPAATPDANEIEDDVEDKHDKHIEL